MAFDDSLASAGGAIDLDGAQRRIASIIINEGLSMGMDWRDIKIGLMTAMQESGMRNLNYGHSTSLGVFQQRYDMGWGTQAQIMDPHYSARKFFSTLKQVDGRDQMALWEAAQAVQRSAYPKAYRQHFGIASQTLKWFRQNNPGMKGTRRSPASDPSFKPDRQSFDLTAGDKALASRQAPALKAPKAPGMAASTEPLVLPNFTGKQDFNDALERMGMMPRGPKGPNQTRQQILQFAKQFIGDPYDWGGQNPGGFDCSGLIYYVMDHFGYNVPRISYQLGQQGYNLYGGRRDISKLSPGDLVMWDNSSRNSGADHVAFYLGNGLILEAPRPGRSVGISELYDMDNAWGVHLNL